MPLFFIGAATYYFANLDEVEEFVQRFGHTLENIKWRIEINAP